MGVVLGLLLGAGLACVWWSFWPAPSRRTTNRYADVVRDTLVQAGVTGVGPGVLLRAGLAGAFVLGSMALLVVPVPAVAGVGAAFGAALPWVLLRGRARRRVLRLRRLWPQVVDDLASAVRAGLSLPEAVAALGERGPAELRAPFAAFAVDYRASGRFGDSLDTLKDRLADPVADRIVEALRLTREVGGTDLGRLLRTLSVFLREDLATRGELEARASWTVNAARLAVAAPWVVLAMLGSRPEAAGAYGSPTGVLVLLSGAGCSAFAYWLMLRLGRLPDDPRVLR
ncbi:MAG TPA: type II secretion system F family protein [Cellulomonas sp.]